MVSMDKCIFHGGPPSSGRLQTDHDSTRFPAAQFQPSRPLPTRVHSYSDLMADFAQGLDASKLILVETVRLS